jgi:hypothetical protein
MSGNPYPDDWPPELPKRACTTTTTTTTTTTDKETVIMPEKAQPKLADQPIREERKTEMPEQAQPKLAPVPENEEQLSIAKPAGFDINKFKSKRAAAMAGVETLQTALPVYRIADAKDFVRLHPDEDNYWSDALCFVSVPIKGQKNETLHLIEENLAMEYLPSARVLRFRLALATKPWDIFFLCQIPTENLDNGWNESNVMACLSAKGHWVMATSRKAEGAECYKVDFAKHEDAFAEPDWPTQSLSELISVTFAGRMIDREDHPGLLRLIGAKQDKS